MALFEFMNIVSFQSLFFICLSDHFLCMCVNLSLDRKNKIVCNPCCKFPADPLTLILDILLNHVFIYVVTRDLRFIFYICFFLVSLHLLMAQWSFSREG